MRDWRFLLYPEPGSNPDQVGTSAFPPVRPRPAPEMKKRKDFPLASPVPGAGIEPARPSLDNGF